MGESLLIVLCVCVGWGGVNGIVGRTAERKNAFPRWAWFYFQVDILDAMKRMDG